MGEIVRVRRKRRHTFVLGLGDDEHISSKTAQSNVNRIVIRVTLRPRSRRTSNSGAPTDSNTYCIQRLARSLPGNATGNSQQMHRL
jgi:hypothetical protein